MAPRPNENCTGFMNEDLAETDRGCLRGCWQRRINLQPDVFDEFSNFASTLPGALGQSDDHLIQIPGPTIHETFRHAHHWNFMNTSVPLLAIIIEESHDRSARTLSIDQLTGHQTPGFACPNDSHAARWIGARVTLPGRAFTPQ